MGKTESSRNILFRAIDGIVQIVYLHGLWVGFSLLGGILFGVFPSTIALYEVIRKWETEGFHKETSTFQTFWSAYRKAFRKGNAVGGILFVTGGFLGADLLIVSRIDHIAGFGLTFIFSILLGLFLLVLLFIFPVIVYFEEPLFRQLKYSLLLGMSSLPYVVLQAAAWTVVLAFFLFVLPAAAIVSISSILALVHMKIAGKAINRAHLKQQQGRKKESSSLMIQEI
ncbi:YesL family protein [Salibacterium aidingense]|uniref:YesL family protein n=1 Tax=Salibacterium aidingense TaxID=384933 RepID=UPI003BBE9683